jgi:hypothetical protein
METSVESEQRGFLTLKLAAGRPFRHPERSRGTPASDSARQPCFYVQGRPVSYTTAETEEFTGMFPVRLGGNIMRNKKHREPDCF